MGKSEETRRTIIIKSAELFNEKGYSGCSMNDIMEATGLKKGGIYGHFKNKDELALEAFDYAAEVVYEHFREAVRHAHSAVEQVGAIFDVYADVVGRPPMKGGCPLLNTAVESDDTNPLLRERTLGIFHTFLTLLEEILKGGIQHGEFKEDFPVKAAASFIAATLEGCIMTSKLEGSNTHMAYCREQMVHYLKTLRRDP